MDQSQNKPNSLFRKELSVLPRPLSQVECPLLGFHCPISDKTGDGIQDSGVSNRPGLGLIELVKPSFRAKRGISLWHGWNNRLQRSQKKDQGKIPRIARNDSE
jgi:hypothetical protein